MKRLKPVGPEHLPAVLLPLGIAFFVAGCSMSQKEMSMAGTYEGPPVSVGQGDARAFVVLDEQGKAQTLGIRLSEAALSGLPSEVPSSGEWEYELSLPAQAAVSGYDHISVDWNPQGHIPEGVYDVPHFDFHFYAISMDAQNAISAVGSDLERAHKAPPEAYMPVDYILPPGTEVPRMGAHAIDPTSDEFNHKPFTQTFIYGFYDGEITFMEPMMSLTFLQSKPNVSTPVKQPQMYYPGFAYPAMYDVHYDASAREYTVSLEQLMMH